MKLHYYLMSMALMATASVGFTACDDDDDNGEPVSVITPSKDDNSTIKFTQDTCRVKIGSENIIALPVVENVGTVNAYSITPEVAEIVNVDGNLMIEGFKNGMAKIMVSDESGSYKILHASVYTTDVMEFESTTVTCKALLGYNDEITVKVALGNGGYTATTDNENVTFVSATEEGEITLSAKGLPDAYTVNVTITDASNVSGTVQVTVESTDNPFTQEVLDELCAAQSSTTYTNGFHDDHLLNEHQPAYFMYAAYGYGEWTDANVDSYGGHVFGWWWGTPEDGNGGVWAVYPEGTTVNKDVQGKWLFCYGGTQWWPLHTYNGTVRIVKDDAKSKVVIFHGSEKGIANYGYIVRVY